MRGYEMVGHWLDDQQEIIGWQRQDRYLIKNHGSLTDDAKNIVPSLIYETEVPHGQA